MPQSLRFDDSEVEKLANILINAAGVAVKESRKVVAKGSLNIKTDARRRRAGSKYLPALERAITYETQATPTGAWGEIGPDVDRPQGNLGWIPEYGTQHTPPQPYMLPAGEAERPRFEKALEDLAVKALE